LTASLVMCIIEFLSPALSNLWWSYD